MPVFVSVSVRRSLGGDLGCTLSQLLPRQLPSHQWVGNLDTAFFLSSALGFRLGLVSFQGDAHLERLSSFVSLPGKQSSAGT